MRILIFDIYLKHNSNSLKLGKKIVVVLQAGCVHELQKFLEGTYINYINYMNLPEVKDMLQFTSIQFYK